MLLSTEAPAALMYCTIPRLRAGSSRLTPICGVAKEHAEERARTTQDFAQSLQTQMCMLFPCTSPADETTAKPHRTIIHQPGVGQRVFATAAVCVPPI